MDPRQRAYLEAMGISTWARRTAPARNDAALVAEASLPDDEPHQAPVTADDDLSHLDWDGLQRVVTACHHCVELAGHRTQTVFGVGNPQAELMVVGEAPGAEEDRLGEPFVGRAGKLLDAMLAAIGQDRGTVYIANVLKCRPPRNRDPLPEEADACEAYLHRQIALVRPKVLLVVGRIAAQRLLHSDQAIGRLRGRVHRYGPGGDLPLVVTYHPAYLLRSPMEKRKAWQDLRQVRRLSLGMG